MPLLHTSSKNTAFARVETAENPVDDCGDEEADGQTVQDAVDAAEYKAAQKNLPASAARQILPIFRCGRQLRMAIMMRFMPPVEDLRI